MPVTNSSQLKEKEIVVDGIATNFITGGKGTPLLLIHGWPLCFHLPSEFLETTALNFQIYAVNLPGFGGSTPPNFSPSIENYANHLNKLVRLLGIKEHAVIGWSLGGMVAIKYASKNNSRISRLVLCGTAASGMEVANRLLRNAYQKLEFIIAEIINNKKLLFWLWDQISPADKSKEKSINDLLKIPVSLTKQIFRLALKTKLDKECLSLKNIPTLILSGEKDNLMTVKAGDRLDQLINTSCFLIVPHAWHWNILNPDTTRVVIDFLLGKSKIKNVKN